MCLSNACVLSLIIAAGQVTFHCAFKCLTSYPITVLYMYIIQHGPVVLLNTILQATSTYFNVKKSFLDL